MPIFDEKRYKNSSEPEGHIMIILRSIQSSTNRHKTSLKNDMKKAELENQKQVWKGCKKQPVRQQAWHIPKIWSAAYRHTGRNLCNSF